MSEYGKPTVHAVSPCNHHRCPSCQELYLEANITQHVGCQVTCPHCGEWITVPAEWEAEIELAKGLRKKAPNSTEDKPKSETSKSQNRKTPKPKPSANPRTRR